MIGGNIQTASEVKEFILFQTDVLQQRISWHYTYNGTENKKF
jgi:hypothetical protein